MATKDKQRSKLIEMLEDHQTTMLVTRDKQGGLVSRPMTAQHPEFDGDIWFFVSSDADVIDEIEADSQVNIALSKKENYVSLSGKASLIDDDKTKQDLWYPELKKWFDGVGPESSKVKLIKVEVDTARYWNTANNNQSGQSEEKGSPLESGMIKF